MREYLYFTLEVLDHLFWAVRQVLGAARSIALLFLGLALVEGLGPAITIYLLQRAINEVIGAAGEGIEGFGKVFPWIGLLALSLLLGQEIPSRIRSLLGLRLRQKVEFQLNGQRLTKSADVPLLLFEESQFYDQLARSERPGEKVERLYTNAVGLASGVVRVLSIAALFWSVSRFLSFGLLAVIIPHAIYKLKQSRRWLDVVYGWTEGQRRTDYLDELLTGRSEQKEIRSYGLVGILVERWRNNREALHADLIKQKTTFQLWDLPSRFLEWLVDVGVAIALGTALADGRLDAGLFIALFQGVIQMRTASTALGHALRELIEASAEMGYLRTLLRTPVRHGNVMNCSIQRPLHKGVQLKGVTFTYPGSHRPSLKNIDLQLRPGECVAIVGENGAGKSTLAKLILGLYEPTLGQITIEDTNYEHISRENLHKIISAVFQDYYKFEFSAGQSIALSSGETFDFENVVKAAVAGGAHDFISKLPLRYDTPVGYVLDGGQGLSGGQWQRLAISRALMQDPAILILDEPAAALDPQSEAALYSQLKNVAGDRIVLLISHRLGAARLADKVILLRDGEIIEYGHHDELVALGREYFQMWKEQATWYQ